MPRSQPPHRRPREFTKQLVIRVDERLHKALKEDAEANGRTVAQSARFRLERDLLTA